MSAEVSFICGSEKHWIASTNKLGVSPRRRGEGMNETYHAKSKNKQHDAITNGEHCRKVAALAKRFGDAFGKGFEAAIAGTFHDFGKYGQTFQGVLKGKRQNFDHKRMYSFAVAPHAGA